MRTDFNENWLFYDANKKCYIPVTLPHDAMIDSPRSENSAGGGACAYFDGGVYEYKKELFAPSEWRGKYIALEFEGVYRNAKVYINDVLVGEWAYGYTGFFTEIAEHVRYGSKNEVRVVADNSKLPNSRWYTGGGIYRPVSLIVKDPVHFMLNGISAQTISLSPAKISVSAKHTGGRVRFEVWDGDLPVAFSEGEQATIEIPDAKLWSAESPHLYTLKAVLTEAERVADEEILSFGIRMIEWSNKGLFVNGKQTLLRGGCVHHDNGILGARCYAEAEDRKVRIIRQAGFNAVRFSHNPCSKAFLDACDRYGVYLIDETFDMWYMHKKKHDYASDFPAWHKRDIAAMVEKDKNHPSVIMYSIGNEISEPFEKKGVDTAKEMAEYVRSLDSGRPVTAGINYYIIVNAAKGKGVYREDAVMAEAQSKPKKEKPTSSTLFNMIACRVGPSMNKMGNSKEADRLVSPCMEALDIVGYNYASGRYPMEGSAHPNRVFYGSETYPQDIYRNWEAVKKYPYLVGDFMWAAWDYLGEAGLGGWSYEPLYGFTFEKPYPWLIADTGAIDLIGTIGAEAKYAATVWGLDKKPYIGVRPVNHPNDKVVKSVWRGTNAIASWAWENCEGNRAEIEVYSSAAYIELYLNGKRLGRKKLKECRAFFKTKYAKGVLKAVALDENKKVVSESRLHSCEGALSIRFIPEKTKVKKGEVLFIGVDIADKQGTTESNRDEIFTAAAENGELLAFGSAAQKSELKYSEGRFESYYGKMLAIVKATEKGILKLTVKGQTLQENTVSISVE